MVHQTIPTRMSKASKASSKISPMTASLLLRVSMALIVGTLAACSTGPRTPPSASHEGPETRFPTGEVVEALKPFLRKERQEKIDRALHAARLASLASLALKNRGRGPGAKETP